jgi:peptidoglycan/xylan/chitin deacetylase (PgdA/CDA1 family)
MSLRSRLKSLAVRQTLPASVDSVLLTFDDGPHPEGTPAVLDVLRRFDARAVFFVVGHRIPRAPEMLRPILDEGHTLGNHSFAHPLDRQFGMRKYIRDVTQCQDVIADLTGVRPTLFRPPLGHLSPASIVGPRLLGLRPVLWSIDSGDWQLRTPEDVAGPADRLRAALSNRPLREIVLLHDERTLTARLLERVLPDLVSRGVDLRPDVTRL